MRAKIESEIQKMYNKYLASAEEIVSGYERENTLSRDYEGRQMFELLQNADDESYGSEGKVLVKFDGKTLSISNTGTPFSFAGIKSLLYPNASPKKIHANKIGCKGLGFRSILTWATQVTVATDDFTVQFSPAYAKEFLDQIYEANPALREDIKTLSKEEYPIATLTCPKIIADKMVTDGFATTIIIDCKPQLASVIEKQIKSLEFEELVFLPNLKEIEIICNEDYHKVFFKFVDRNAVLIESKDVLTGNSEFADWVLYKTSGHVLDENNKDRDYEFVIAYDPNGNHSGEVLYSYFKTDVKMVFPALIHGTFELTSDRNSLQKGSIVNHKLMDLLADFLVETAVKISEDNKECNYNPLRLVIASDIDLVLKQTFGLDVKLQEKAKEKRILPTFEGKYISIHDFPKFSEYNFGKFIPADCFNQLLQYTTDKKIIEYITKILEIEFYDYKDFCNLINTSLSYYDMQAKVALIDLIDKEYGVYEKYDDIFPHLLVDSNGENITDNSKVYPIPTEEDEVVELPKWVDVRFLSPDMEQLITREVHLTKRDFVRALARYNVEEYSFKSLLRSVVNQYDEVIVTEDKCNDILNWLWNYYLKEDRQAITEIKVKVVCRDGVIRYAKECYLGREFDNALGERITSVFTNNFISPENIRLKTNDISEISDFLIWVGASKYPRLISLELSEEQIRNYIKYHSSIYSTSDDTYYSYSDFQKFYEVKVGSFENIELLMSKVSFNDIICWIILDDKFNSLIRATTEENNPSSRIIALPIGKLNKRTFAAKYLKSYVRFLLSSNKWIPDGSGKNKENPQHCCFEDNGLAPFIIVPNVDYDYIKEIVGRNCKKDVDLILSNIGVKDFFQELDKEIIYEALSLLPTLDVEGKKGKGIYRKLIRDIDSVDSLIRYNSAYEDFIKNGFVLAKTDMGRKYVPISDARYADKKVFSQKILKNFNMFDVDSRSGEEKIRRLFGVTPLKYVNAEADGIPVVHALDASFVEEYYKFLPFVYACRMGLKNEHQDFNRLKSTKIMLCSDVTIKYDFGGDIRVCKLEKFETVYLRKSNTAYIQVPAEYNIFAQLIKDFDFADAVAELITVILDVNEDKDFYRDLFRENTLVREKKMRIDKNDENLELLNEARRRFKAEINVREAFWMTLSSIMRINIPEEPLASEMIKALDLEEDIDEGVDFDNLNCYPEFLIKVFRGLGIDLDAYNNQSVHTISITDHWRKLLIEKTKVYKNRYLANIYDTVKDNLNNVQEYEEYCNTYDSCQYDIPNSVNVDIDQIFEDEIGVSIEILDSYDDAMIPTLIEEAEKNANNEAMTFIYANYSRATVYAYLLFNRIDELIVPDEIIDETKQDTPRSSQPSLYDIIDSTFAMDTVGVSTVSMQAKPTCQHKPGGKGNYRGKGHVYSEQTEKAKKENGMIGEIVVFKELMQLYPETTRWVSGNAMQANRIEQGDDLCGYDMCYRDENGDMQYVEVKASRSEEITFTLSDNELRFALQYPKNYEIFYVVIGEDSKSNHKVWRLGHLFDFAEGEELMHNSRFTVESKEYSINAKPIKN